MRQRELARPNSPFLPRDRHRRELIHAAPLLTSGLVMWFRPGSGGGSVTTWPDSSGTANPGTIASAQWGFDGPGSIATFNGSSQLVTAANSASLDITGAAVSLSVYLKFTALPAAGKYPSLLAKHVDFRGYGLNTNGDTQVIEFLMGNNTITDWNRTSTPLPATGVWVNYTAVYNGNTMRLFKDGAQVSSLGIITTNPPTTTAGVVIGRHYSSGTFGWFNGSMANAAIWNRALTDREIYDLYRLWKI